MSEDADSAALDIPGKNPYSDLPTPDLDALCERMSTLERCAEEMESRLDEHLAKIRALGNIGRGD